MRCRRCPATCMRGGRVGVGGGGEEGRQCCWGPGGSGADEAPPRLPRTAPIGQAACVLMLCVHASMHASMRARTCAPFAYLQLPALHWTLGHNDWIEGLANARCVGCHHSPACAARLEHHPSGALVALEASSVPLRACASDCSRHAVDPNSTAVGACCCWLFGAAAPPRRTAHGDDGDAYGIDGLSDGMPIMLV